MRRSPFPAGHPGLSTSASSRRLAGPVLALLLTIGGAVASENQSPPSGELPTTPFLYYNPDASALPPAELLAALETYARYYRDRGVADLHPIYFRRAADMERYLEGARERGQMPLFGSLATPYLLERGYRWGYRPILCGVRSGTTTYRSAVIARRGSGIDSLAAAKDRVLALVDVGGDLAGWTNVTTFGNRLDVRSFFRELLVTDGPASAVLAVIFNKADLAVVDKELFERMNKQAPMIWQKVREIHQAPPFTITGLVTARETPAELVGSFKRELLGDVRGRPGGGELLDAFYIDGFQECGWGNYEADTATLRAAGMSLPTTEEREAATRPGAD